MQRLLLIGVPLVVAGALAVLILTGFVSLDRSSTPAVSIATPSTTPTPSATPTATPTPSPTPTPEPPEELRYREAIEARDRGDLDLAASELRRIASDDGPLAPFAAFRLAQVLVSAGEYEDAIDAFTLAFNDTSLPLLLRPIGRIEGAAALEALERPEEAVEWLNVTINDPDATASDVISARWQRARILRDLGDVTWVDDASAIVAEAPGHWSAALALDALELAELDAPSLSAAYVRYLARDNARATERYEAVLLEEPEPAVAAIAWFYLGALGERLPDRAAAIEAYTESIAVDPAGSRADDAAYWRGRVAEEEGDFEAAAEFYDFLVAEYPSSGFTADGALRGALAVFELEDEAGALERLAAIATAGGPQAAAASRWYDLIGGPDARAEVGVPAAHEIDPRSLAAILAVTGPSALDPPLIEPLPSPVENPTAVDEWLIGRYGVSTGAVAGLDRETADFVQILLDAGERSLARVILLEQFDAVASDPHAVIALGEAATTIELHDAGLIAAMRILGGLPTEERLGTPLELERLAYPAPWEELVTAAAEEFGVPPLLLLALVRQESAFEPDVISPAGAIGLTQVIPPTGEQVARLLDEPWAGPVSLTHPETSLRYGAAYLAEQLEEFEGNIFAALAAYNAGPFNAQRWLDAQVWTGADGYVQAIDFEETRSYVEGVVEQYAWYRYAYGLAEAPAIR